MADIARLFLDGARPTNGHTPQRIGPKDRVPAREAAAVTPEVRPVVKESSWSLPPALLGVTGLGGDAAWAQLLTAAATLAEEHATTICLIGERNNAFVMELVGQESSEDAPRFTGGGGVSADLQIARAMFTLRPCVGTWLLACPESPSEAFSAVVAQARQRLVVCAAEGDKLIAAYQQLKRAAAVAPAEQMPRAFIVGANAAAAVETHGRLRKAAQEFLHHDLPLAGTGAMRHGGSRLATIAMKAGERALVWASVVDELFAVASPESGQSEAMDADVHPSEDIEAALEKVAAASAELHDQSVNASAMSHAVFDQLAHVLDPEERAALGADLGEVSEVIEPEVTAAVKAVAVRVEAVAEQGVSRSAEVIPQTPAVALKRTAHGLTLRVFDLLHSGASDRALQWQVVEQSIGELVSGATVLDARPPVSWASECCIAVDAGGKLHVWTLYKDGVSWFALREWAAEHRNLLALTRRDLSLDRAAEVTVHVVLPLEVEGAGGGGADIQTLLRAPSKTVVLYRLRAVEWNGRQGIVVVPIA
jgi:hypothetical protein